MAFRAPSRVHRRRQSYQSVPSLQTPSTLEIPSPTFPADEDDSKEWVLFSPEAASSSVARTHTTSTEKTPRTVGRSRLSDFGSFAAPTQSGIGEDESEGDNGTLEGEDIGELDSLDDGLHEFREPDQFQLRQSDPAVLPAHDGLGTFAASSLPVQEQFWQHERLNPHRPVEIRPRRRSSVQRHLDSLEELESRDVEHERWERIEQWRMEQSRAILEDIEKETRRRFSRASHRIAVSNRQASSAAVESTAESNPAMTDTPMEDSEKEIEAEESFWQRITRKVIRELMGLDDTMLAVIFGEALVDEDTQNEDASHKQSGSATRTSVSRTRIEPDKSVDMDDMLKNVVSPPAGDDWWQQKLLDRVAHELDDLVHQLRDHPGAFTTYAQPSSLASSQHAGNSTPRPPSSYHTRSRSTSSLSRTPISPAFKPTLLDHATRQHATLWGIEEEGPGTTSHSSAVPGHSTRESDRDYWERELDVKMVFRYLYRGLAGKITNKDGGGMTNPQETRTHRSASMIQHHHPLVARARATSQSRRPLNLQTRSSNSGIPLARTRGTNPRDNGSPASPVRAGQPLLFHHVRRPSSCASQSTLVSASTKKTVGGSSSSRNYWDIGGSVGSGSAVVTVGGGMGSWGDV